MSIVTSLILLYYRMLKSLTSQKDLGLPDYEKALEQHRNYVKALEACNVKVTSLEADERFPDSCFVEDAAILTKKIGIITRPGAESRRGEEEKIHEALKKFYVEKDLVKIQSPGTIEGGDVMMVRGTFYIGLSERTNEEGANQAIEPLERYGYKGVKVPLKEFLHLKTALSYLEENRILITVDVSEYQKLDGGLSCLSLRF